MTAFEAGAPLRRQRRIRPSRVDRPNWKAECAETCLLRLERGKGCEALPIATRLPPDCGRILPLLTERAGKWGVCRALGLCRTAEQPS